MFQVLRANSLRLLFLTLLCTLSSCTKKGSFRQEEKKKILPIYPPPDLSHSQDLIVFKLELGLVSEGEKKFLRIENLASSEADYVQVKVCQEEDKTDCKPAEKDLRHSTNGVFLLYELPQGKLKVSTRACVDRDNAVEKDKNCGPWVSESFRQSFANSAEVKAQAKSLDEAKDKMLRACQKTRQSLKEIEKKELKKLPMDMRQSLYNQLNLITPELCRDIFLVDESCPKLSFIEEETQDAQAKGQSQAVKQKEEDQIAFTLFLSLGIPLTLASLALSLKMHLKFKEAIRQEALSAENLAKKKKELEKRKKELQLLEEKIKKDQASSGKMSAALAIQKKALTEKQEKTKQKQAALEQEKPDLAKQAQQSELERRQRLLTQSLGDLSSQAQTQKALLEAKTKELEQQKRKHFLKRFRFAALDQQTRLSQEELEGLEEASQKTTEKFKEEEEKLSQEAKKRYYANRSLRKQKSQDGASLKKLQEEVQRREESRRRHFQDLVELKRRKSELDKQESSLEQRKYLLRGEAISQQTALSKSFREETELHMKNRASNKQETRVLSQQALENTQKLQDFGQKKEAAKKRFNSLLEEQKSLLSQADSLLHLRKLQASKQDEQERMKAFSLQLETMLINKFSKTEKDAKNLTQKFLAPPRGLDVLQAELALEIERRAKGVSGFFTSTFRSSTVVTQQELNVLFGGLKLHQKRASSLRAETRRVLSRSLQSFEFESLQSRLQAVQNELQALSRAGTINQLGEDFLLSEAERIRSSQEDLAAKKIKLDAESISFFQQKNLESDQQAEKIKSLESEIESTEMSLQARQTKLLKKLDSSQERLDFAQWRQKLSLSLKQIHKKEQETRLLDLQANLEQVEAARLESKVSLAEKKTAKEASEARLREKQAQYESLERSKESLKAGLKGHRQRSSRLEEEKKALGAKLATVTKSSSEQETEQVRITEEIKSNEAQAARLKSSQKEKTAQLKVLAAQFEEERKTFEQKQNESAQSKQDLTRDQEKSAQLRLQLESLGAEIEQESLPAQKKVSTSKSAASGKEAKASGSTQEPSRQKSSKPAKGEKQPSRLEGSQSKKHRFSRNMAVGASISSLAVTVLGGYVNSPASGGNAELLVEDENAVSPRNQWQVIVTKVKELVKECQIVKDNEKLLR